MKKYKYRLLDWRVANDKNWSQRVYIIEVEEVTPIKLFGKNTPSKKFIREFYTDDDVSFIKCPSLRKCSHGLNEILSKVIYGRGKVFKGPGE